MKYQMLIVKDLFNKKFLKWIILYMFLITLDVILIYSKIKTPFFNQDDINTLLAVIKPSNLDFLGILILLYNVLITIYFAYTIYNYEYMHSKEFISLRISNRKRNLLKLFVLNTLIFISRIVYYIIIYFIFNKYYQFNIFVFLKNIYIYLLIATLVFIISHINYLINKR